MSQQGFSFNPSAGSMTNLNYLNLNFNDQQAGLDITKVNRKSFKRIFLHKFISSFLRIIHS